MVTAVLLEHDWVDPVIEQESDVSRGVKLLPARTVNVAVSELDMPALAWTTKLLVVQANGRSTM